MKRLASCCMLLLLLAGCGWSRQCISPRTYSLNEEKNVSVGSPLIQSGCFASRYDPRGINKILWRRASCADEYFVPRIDQEILYSGRDGNTLHITYREYFYQEQTNTSYARQPFFQQLYYDMSKSDLIVFQDWVIKVLDSNNESIRFKVIKEPARPTIEPPVI